MEASASSTSVMEPDDPRRALEATMMENCEVSGSVNHNQANGEKIVVYVEVVPLKPKHAYALKYAVRLFQAHRGDSLTLLHVLSLFKKNPAVGRGAVRLGPGVREAVEACLMEHEQRALSSLEELKKVLCETHNINADVSIVACGAADMKTTLMSTLRRMKATKVILDLTIQKWPLSTKSAVVDSFCKDDVPCEVAVIAKDRLVAQYSPGSTTELNACSNSLSDFKFNTISAMLSGGSLLKDAAGDGCSSDDDESNPVHAHALTHSTAHSVSLHYAQTCTTQVQVHHHQEEQACTPQAANESNSSLKSTTPDSGGDTFNQLLTNFLEKLPWPKLVTQSEPGCDLKSTKSDYMRPWSLSGNASCSSSASSTNRAVSLDLVAPSPCATADPSIPASDGTDRTPSSSTNERSTTLLVPATSDASFDAIDPVVKAKSLVEGDEKWILLGEERKCLVDGDGGKHPYVSTVPMSQFQRSVCHSSQMENFDEEDTERSGMPCTPNRQDKEVILLCPPATHIGSSQDIIDLEPSPVRLERPIADVPACTSSVQLESSAQASTCGLSETLVASDVDRKGERLEEMESIVDRLRRLRRRKAEIVTSVTECYWKDQGETRATTTGDGVSAELAFPVEDVSAAAAAEAAGATVSSPGLDEGREEPGSSSSERSVIEHKWSAKSLGFLRMALLEEMRPLELENKKLKEELDRLREDLQQVKLNRERVWSEVADKEEKYRKEIETLDASVKDLTARLKENEKKNDSLLAELQKLEGDKQQAQSRASFEEGRRTNLEHLLKEAQSSLQAIVKTMNECRKKEETFKKDLEQANRNLEEEKRKVNESDAHRNDEATKRAILEIQLQNLQDEVNEKSAALESVPKPLCEFSYEELQHATDQFSEGRKLGESRFGTMYVGEMSIGRVGIKVLRSGWEQELSDDELKKELENLSCIHHPNLVMLIGACVEHRCLVYEYMDNGSLQNVLLSRRAGGEPLQWHIRFRIAAEVGRALHFLHTCLPQPNVHRDLRPANIFLDKNYVSKIGNLALNRLVPQAVAESYAMQDTMQPQPVLLRPYAYIDPEYYLTGNLGPQSDVYALGIIILQLLTGKNSPDVSGAMEVAIADNQLESILDRTAGRWNLDKAEKVALLALKCAEIRRRNRPDLQTQILPVLETVATSAAEEVTSGSSMRHVAVSPEAMATMFMCPITQDIMDNPVVAADGHTYERTAIQSWLQTHQTSPMTNLIMANKDVIPNHSLRSSIVEWRHLWRTPPANH